MSHAKYSPSAAHRWLQCTAAPSAEIGYDDTTSDAADRGSLYHAVGEVMLTRLTTPASAAPLATKADLRRAFNLAFTSVRTTGTGSIDKRAAARLMDKADAEILVLPYVTDVLDNCGWAIAKGSLWGIEAKLDMTYLGGECWGTADFWSYHNGVLDMIDLKTGRHAVDPEGNLQLILYVLGALILLGREGVSPDDVREIRVTVHQGGSGLTWCTTVEDLLQYETKYAAALSSAQKGGDLVAGDHCRWCLAKGDCPAYADRGLSLARSDFAVVTATDNPENTLATMPGHVAAEFLSQYAEIEGFMKTAIEVLAERAYREGLEIPGFKVIRSATRKAWIDKDDAAAKLRKKFGGRAFKEQLLTPTQAIKEFDEKAVEELWTLPTGNLKLVTEATRGKVVTASAAIEFADKPNDDATE